MKKFFYLLTLLSSSAFVHAQPGKQSGSFSDAMFGNCNGGCAAHIMPGVVYAKAIRFVNDISGGSLVTAGYLDNGSNKDFFAVRVTNDGTLNPNFGNAGRLIINLGSDDQAWGMVSQPDGKIILAGSSDNDFALVRFEGSYGALDNTFGVNGIVKTDIGSSTLDQGFAVARQSDGKILVAGISSATGGGDFTIVRYNNNGTLDNTFGGGDGKVTTDIGTNTVDLPFSMKIMPNGKILLAGFTANGTIDDFQTTDIAVARYNADGTLDATFDGDGKFTMNIGAVDVANRVDVDAAGKVIIGGYTGTGAFPSNNRDFLAIRLSPAGVPDVTFNGDGVVTHGITSVGIGTTNDDPAYGLAVQADGKIILAGTQDGGAFTLVRFTVDGNLDPGFGTNNGWTFGRLGYGYPHGVATDVIITQYDDATGTHVRIAATGQGNATDLGVATWEGDIPALVLPVEGSLPLTLLSFSAQKQSNNILLQWQTEREANIAGFDIQRSADGKAFKTLGYAQPITTTGIIKKDYSYADNNPLSAINYYRLVIKDLDGSVKYSKILAVKNNSTSQQLEVFPNPLPAGSPLQLQLPAGLKGRTTLQISDVTGRIVRSMLFETGGNALSTSVDVNALNKGVYIIRVKNNNNVTLTTKFVKN